MIISGGVGREVRANFENPSISLSDASLIQMFGGDVMSSAGPMVSESSAFSTSIAVYRAIALLSGMAAGLPLKTYRYRGKEETFCRPLAKPGFDRTPFEFKELCFAHLLGWGNAFVYKRRNAYDAIDALLPVAPDRVKVEIDQKTLDNPVKVFKVRDANGVYHPMTSREIMHVPGLGYDGVRGLSPIGVARQAIGIQSAADDLASRLYANGNLIGGVLTTDRSLTQAQADALKARWRDKVQGSRHAHDVAVLDSGISFTPTTLAPEEAQFLQTRRWQVVEVARLYGLPPHMLGDVERSTSWGTGIEQQNIAMVAYTLKTWLTRFEERVTAEIVEPSTQYAEFNVDGLLRGSIAERYAAYSTGISMGFLTRNEVREKENLQPIDGLDEPLQPLNMGSGAVQIPGDAGTTLKKHQEE
ncbi:MAG: phage portal protein [Frankiaceae bacterium]